MTKTSGRPYSDTRLAKFVEKRVLELRPAKTQRQIAAEAGYTNPNMLSMLKTGVCRLPLDRVPGLARALETDPVLLFVMAVEQAGGTEAATVERIFHELVTENEGEWLREIRSASGNSDPRLTSRARSAIRGIFGR